MQQHIHIDEARIRAKAYEPWQARGCPEGSGDQDWIEAMDVSGMAVSPIDWIRHRIEEAGIRTGEVTGRKNVIEYQPDGTAKLAIRESDERGVRGAMAAFARCRAG